MDTVKRPKRPSALAPPRQAPQTPIHVRKTGEIIADQIRNTILSGRLKAGDTLQTEAEIIADFGVSRPSVREAFASSNPKS